MRKNDILEIQIDDIKFPNIGIGHVGGKKVQVKGGLPGQRLKIHVLKSGRNPKVTVQEVLQPALQENPPACPVFGLRGCGGCAFQNIPYKYEAELKTAMVKRLLAPLNIEDAFLPTIPAASETAYRNKMEYSFGDDGNAGNLTLGMRRKGSFYEAISAAYCLIAHPDFGRILTFTRDFFAAAGHAFFHRRKLTGTLRHLIVRRGVETKEVLVNLVTAGNFDELYTKYAAELLKIPLEGRIAGILNTINNSPADAVVAEEVKILYGRDFYYEQFSKPAGSRCFKVSAFSFFQTNTQMAGDVLYATIADFAGDLKGKTLFDLYCGTGTIGIFLAKNAPDVKVVGIELIEEAVSAAEKNAALNAAENCQFIAGDVAKIVKTLDIFPDIITLDPPREGINPKAIPHIIAFGAKKIIYVSCKPSSLVNDLPHFIAAGYRVEKIQCVDMFPRTANIEAVVLLQRKDCD